MAGPHLPGEGVTGQRGLAVANNPHVLVLAPLGSETAKERSRVSASASSH